MSQADHILDHMVHIGPITPIEALRLYGSFRLSARIQELKLGGAKIKTETVKVGPTTHVASYSLES